MKIAPLLVLVLSGCASIAVPVSYKFPEAPEALLKPCKPLAEYKDQSLSSIIKITSDNFTVYHDCATNNEAWIEWYREQKAISDAANK